MKAYHTQFLLRAVERFLNSFKGRDGIAMAAQMMSWFVDEVALTLSRRKGEEVLRYLCGATVCVWFGQ